MIVERETPSAVIADRSFLVDRPVAILMVFLATVVFGFFSFLRLPVSLMPELSYPTLTVRTEYPGAAPEEVENDVTRPLEEALGVILVVGSTAFHGRDLVVVEAVGARTFGDGDVAFVKV